MTYQPSHRRPRWHDRPRAWLTAALGRLRGHEVWDETDDHGNHIGGDLPDVEYDREPPPGSRVVPTVPGTNDDYVGLQGTITRNAEARVYAKLAPCSDQGCMCRCFRWTGSHDKDGYGRIRVNGRQTGVHRVVSEAEVGPIPDGLVIDHVVSRGCVHRDCVRIDHLEPVTVRVNSLRGNTLNAMNAAKTACYKGHPFDSANTYWRSDGKRHCRSCKRNWQRERAAARQAEPPDVPRRGAPARRGAMPEAGNVSDPAPGYLSAFASPFGAPGRIPSTPAPAAWPVVWWRPRVPGYVTLLAGT